MKLTKGGLPSTGVPKQSEIILPLDKILLKDEKDKNLIILNKQETIPAPKLGNEVKNFEHQKLVIPQPIVPNVIQPQSILLKELKNISDFERKSVNLKAKEVEDNAIKKLQKEMLLKHLNSKLRPENQTQKASPVNLLRENTNLDQVSILSTFYSKLL